MGGMTKAPPLAPPSEISRYQDGWRRGKPEEDPEKTKNWGFISAKPSEFLIRMRGGEVTTSGQGRTVFKWPWESVAVVPTTVQRLHFVADQITREKVGVKVTGIAVYRIAEPLIAFRMLNFSFPERAQEKLAEMMEELCTGASRRLIANLTVEQCLTQRKAALAGELIREIAPVVEGQGRLEDTTSRGWGLVVDTIEIQDVRVMSQGVFANMQAPFREDQARVAREAELARTRIIRSEETSTEREVELIRVSASEDIRRQKQQAEEGSRLEKIAMELRVEEQRQAQERATRARQLANEREFQLAKLAAEQEVKTRRQLADDEAQAAKMRAEQALQLEVAQLSAQSELARHQARLAEESQQAELIRARVSAAEAKLMLAELEARAAELELHTEAMREKLELDHAERKKVIANLISPEAIQLAVAEKLPELAKAFQQNMGEVHVTAIDGANPYGYIASAIEGVLGLAKSAGLALPKSADLLKNAPQ
jgi:uncharacterized membrane protein YqiK